jgi:hypothetical protein
LCGVLIFGGHVGQRRLALLVVADVVLVELLHELRELLRVHHVGQIPPGDGLDAGRVVQPCGRLPVAASLRRDDDDAVRGA